MLADDVLAVADAAGLTRFSVAGVSLGGMIGMELALRAPHRLEKLALICTSATMDSALWNDRIGKIRDEGIASIAALAMGRFLSDAAEPAVVEGVRRHLVSMDGEGYAGCGAAIRDMELADRIGGIAQPPSSSPTRLTRRRPSKDTASIWSRDIRAIGVDAQGRFTDRHERTIDRCFKLYPWEDMLREPFAAHLKPGVFIEPPWKSIVSNKGILPLLGELHPGHPNLLPAFFADDPRATARAHTVSKPMFSREGENITIMKNGQIVEAAEGSYGGEQRVVQDFAPLFETEGLHAVLGSWMIGDRPAGLGVREDAGLITRNLSRFVPHFIED